jgi:hypothetical protein
MIEAALTARAMIKTSLTWMNFKYEIESQKRCWEFITIGKIVALQLVGATSWLPWMSAETAVGLR